MCQKQWECKGGEHLSDRFLKTKYTNFLIFIKKDFHFRIPMVYFVGLKWKDGFPDLRGSFMNESTMTNMTEGKPFRILLRFTIPLLLGYLLQQLYGMIDTIVVGKYLGVDALAGVGSTAAINFLVLGFCTGLCSGFAIPVAQKFGQQDFSGLRQVVANILWIGTGFAVVLTLVICALCRNVLIWTRTPAETFQYAYTYIFIVFLGIPATIFYNAVAGIVRSLGNSRTPLVALIFAGLLNALLDIVLIVWGNMGVAGAAIATVASQLVSGLICLIYMIRHYPMLHLGGEDLKLRKNVSGRLLAMGVPMGLQYSITAIGSTILQAAVNSLGASAMAAVTAGSRCYALLSTPNEAIGTAAATYTGQNVGAGKIDRIPMGTKVCMLIGTAYAAFSFLLVLLFGNTFIMMFLDSDATQVNEILEYGRLYLLTNVGTFVFVLIVNLFRFSIQGMGYSSLAIVAGVLELVGRAVLAIWLVPRIGFLAVCLAAPVAWVLADAFLIPMYFVGLRKLRRQHTTQ